MASAAGGEQQVCDVRADYALGVEDYTEAIRLHAEVLRKHPENALAHYHLGFAEGIMGNRTAEVREYQRAAALGLEELCAIPTAERLRKEISKSNPHFVLKRYCAVIRDFFVVPWTFRLGPEVALALMMKLWKADSDAIERPQRIMQHEVVIGPLCASILFQRKARLYYCKRCTWSFLVCESKVVVLNKDGSPMNRNESSARFNADEDACPVLEAFASEVLKRASAARAIFPRT